jgi:hypothetical protein
MSLSSSASPDLLTMLVNVPSAYPYLADWVPYNATGPTTSAATPAADPTYVVNAYSGSGGTTGTQIALYANDSEPWSVPSGDTLDVAAALNSSGNTGRCGALIGHYGSRYLDYPAPFWAYDDGGASPDTTNLNGLNLFFQSSLSSSGQYVCTIKTTSGGEVMTAGQSTGVDLPAPRQNGVQVVVIKSGSTYPSVCGGEGWYPYAYYQPTYGDGYAAWGSVSFNASSDVYGWQPAAPYTFQIGCYVGSDADCVTP